MKTDFSDHDQESRMNAWAHELASDSFEIDTLHLYFDTAQKMGRSDQALRLFSMLRQKWPGDMQVCSLYIALCLQTGEDAAAMEAVEAMAATGKPDDALLDVALAVRDRLGPMRADASDAHSLSLCMIVRNEGACLGPCLVAVKPLVDEIVLIDTGSSDRTADIGKLYGASVHHFQWCDDFSAARNFSIKMAQGKWILILDADEAIATADFDTLRKLIRHSHGKTGAFAVETRNYSHLANAVGWQANDGRYPRHEAGVGWFPSIKVRLFQRREEIRFHFPVHERVEPSLRNAGISVNACPVVVHHYGHLNEQRNLQKAHGYYALGYAKLDELGDDLSAIRELAVQAGQLGRWEEAIGLWNRLLKIQPDYSEAIVNLAGVQWQQGNYEASLKSSKLAMQLCPSSKEAKYNHAMSLLFLGKAELAVATLQEVVAVHQSYLGGRFMLAIAFLASGDNVNGQQALSIIREISDGATITMAIDDIALP